MTSDGITAPYYFTRITTDKSLDRNSLFHLENHNLIHQIRHIRKGGGLCIFVHKTICFKLRPVCNSEDIEALSFEIMNKTSEDLVLSKEVLYKKE